MAISQRFIYMILLEKTTLFSILNKQIICVFFYCIFKKKYGNVIIFYKTCLLQRQMLELLEYAPNFYIFYVLHKIASLM